MFSKQNNIHPEFLHLPPVHTAYTYIHSYTSSIKGTSSNVYCLWGSVTFVLFHILYQITLLKTFIPTYETTTCENIQYNSSLMLLLTEKNKLTFM